MLHCRLDLELLDFELYEFHEQDEVLLQLCPGLLFQVGFKDRVDLLLLDCDILKSLAGKVGDFLALRNLRHLVFFVHLSVESVHRVESWCVKLDWRISKLGELLLQFLDHSQRVVVEQKAHWQILLGYTTWDPLELLVAVVQLADEVFFDHVLTLDLELYRMVGMLKPDTQEVQKDVKRDSGELLVQLLAILEHLELLRELVVWVHGVVDQSLHWPVLDLPRIHVLNRILHSRLYHNGIHAHRLDFPELMHRLKGTSYLVQHIVEHSFPILPGIVADFHSDAHDLVYQQRVAEIYLLGNMLLFELLDLDFLLLVAQV